VLSSPFVGEPKMSVEDGDIDEEDYSKQSIYSLLYSIYRSMGVVQSDRGIAYEQVFNTWGYAWPEDWGTPPVKDDDPQLFGKNAYAGHFQWPLVKDYLAERDGKVHVVEMGCGTGAGAHHICKNVLPKCTFECVDMQQAAIHTCDRKFVPELGGRLKATRADCTQLPIGDATTDFVIVNETHVTEMSGQATDEDRKFFGSAERILKPGGFLLWGNAIPDDTWQPCFELLEEIGLKRLDVRDVTQLAIDARDQDAPRIEAYVKQCLDKFFGFRIPILGNKKRLEAEAGLKNFIRHPGSNLYQNMTDGTDTYKLVIAQKPA
jgi:ubiquinone/menaquinone biosynthesis C-methylase UbiE